MNVKISLWGTLGLIASGALHAQSTPVIDNERVTVWDVMLKQGVAGPVTPEDADVVILFLEGGTLTTTDRHGTAAAVHREFGEAVLIRKGSRARDTLNSPGSAHEVVIALKSFVAPPTVNPTRYPAAFPRPGSQKMLENDRVVVWRYSWLPGKPTPMHYHDKDVVVAYRFDGELKSVTPDGQVSPNVIHAGDIRFNKAARTHYEELVSARASAVMMELKSPPAAQ